MSSPRVTISMPVYRRPLRTALAIQSILNQTVTDWEAFILGDGCPDFDKIPGLVVSGLKIRVYRSLDPRMTVMNFGRNFGGCGYRQTNYAINNATGKYFVFLGNDDYLLPNHFENYLSEIEGTDLDFVWFPRVSSQGRPYRFKLRSWKIGHAGLIIRTDFLKEMPPHQPAYNHDWSLVNNMIRAGAKYKKGNSKITYHMDPYGYRGTGKDGDNFTRSANILRWHSKLAKRVKKIFLSIVDLIK